MTRKYSHPKYNKFRFDAGSLALNFVATVRHRGAQPRDLLTTPEVLADWLKLTGCSKTVVLPSFHDFEKSILLREAIYRTVRSFILNEAPDAIDVNCINDTAAYSLAVPQIEAVSYVVRWESVHPIKACLAEIARDAINIIGHIERNHLKMCDNHGCQMLFLDNSPANRRRWCAMSLCGNREKVKMHRQQKKCA